MTAYTDDDVNEALRALDHRRDFGVIRTPAVVAILDVVAPQIAARALREAADWFHCDRCLERARAEQVSE